jgi:hypothetical protein
MTNRRAWAAIALLALGAAAVVFALPGAWPQPLPDGEIDGEALVQLRVAAAEVDAACQRGDVERFATVTTAAYRRELDRGLATVDGVVDGAFLRLLGEQRRCSDWFAGDLLGGIVRDKRAVVAVQQALAAPSQLVAFRWNGQRWQFDGAMASGAAGSAAANAAAAAFVRQRAEQLQSR